MSTYFIQSKFPSTPMFTWADEGEDSGVFCAPKVPENKGRWDVLPQGGLDTGLVLLQLSDDPEHRQVASINIKYVVVRKRGDLWVIKPPLSVGGPETPRTISVSFGAPKEPAEWTIIDGTAFPEVPNFYVSAETRWVDEKVKPASYWYFIPAKK